MRKKRLLVYAMVMAVWHLLPMTVCRVTGQTAGASTLCPQPKSLKIEALSQNRAVVGWALGDGQGIPSKYQLLVKRKADDAEVKSDDALVAQDNRVTIEGLEAGVEYYVRLKSDCRDSYEDVSEWSEPLYFSTLTESKTLPWGENFDEKKEMPKGWIVTAGDVSVSSAAYHGDAGYSMLLQTDGNEPAMVVSAQTAHAADDMYFKAWVKAGKGTKYQIGLTENVADVSAFVPIYDGEVTTDNEWTEIRLGTAAYRNEVDVVGERASFAIFLPDGVSAAVYVDDIEVTEMPECVRPEELKVEGVEATVVTLSWIGQTGVEKYEVSLTTGGVEEIREVAGSPATVTGLKPNTSYTVKVRTVCADGVESDWSTGEVGFKTSCGTAECVVQLHNFDASGELPECWVQKQTEPGYCCGEDYGDKAWVIGQDKSYSGASSLKMQQSNLETHTILAMQ